MITKEIIGNITDIKNDSILSDITKYLNESMVKYSIDTPQRIRHFLAQLMCESNGLKNVVENMNYSSTGLLKTWPSHFDAISAVKYAHNPKALGSYIYANKLGNGDEASHDGWTYRGRGYIGVTGKAQYKQLSDDFGVDFIAHPELLETIQYASLSAGHFWGTNNLNHIADNAGDDVSTVTRKVNGGYLGLKVRQDYYNKLKTLVK